jgi:hypothetical protein
MRFELCVAKSKTPRILRSTVCSRCKASLTRTILLKDQSLLRYKIMPRWQSTLGNLIYHLPEHSLPLTLFEENFILDL